VENQFLFIQISDLNWKLNLATDNQHGRVFKKLNQDNLNFSQEDASTSILMRERTLIMISFYLLMLEIDLTNGQPDITSLNIKFMMILLNNGSSMRRLVQSIIMRPQITSFKTIKESFKLVKLVTLKLQANSQKLPENGSGMVPADNSKLKLEITLTSLVLSTHQSQTSTLKSVSTA